MKQKRRHAPAMRWCLWVMPDGRRLVAQVDERTFLALDRVLCLLGGTGRSEQRTEGTPDDVAAWAEGVSA